MFGVVPGLNRDGLNAKLHIQRIISTHHTGLSGDCNLHLRKPFAVYIFEYFGLVSINDQGVFNLVSEKLSQCFSIDFSVLFFMPR